MYYLKKINLCAQVILIQRAKIRKNVQVQRVPCCAVCLKRPKSSFLEKISPEVICGVKKKHSYTILQNYFLFGREVILLHTESRVASIASHGRRGVQKYYFSTKKKVIVLHFFNRITTNVKVISIADVTMRVL